ncbi:MAG: hypothetical protein AAGE13_03895 [Pseudomonadota bacterium]
MTKPLTLPAIAALLAFGLAPHAHAWDRTETVELSNGKTRALNVTGACKGRSCTRNAIRVGPNGRTITTTGTRDCANGTCTAEQIKTGPNDRSITRTRTINR